MFWTSKHFEYSDIPDLSGKIAIITGASSGIGKVSAFELARKNCQIIFACRNEAKTTVVIEEIKKETGNAKLEFIEIDMLSLDSIKTFIDTFKSKYTQLDLLLNNAGLFSYPPTTSEDGLDAQFQVNHLALFYLTTALLPILENTKSSRVVNVGSAAHNAVFGEIDFAKMNKPENHGSNQHYCVSKCCTNLFTFELARRLEEKGEKDIYVNVCHPGSVLTDLPRSFIPAKRTWLRAFYNFVIGAVPVELGALTQVYLSTSPEVIENNYKGLYFVPYGKIAKASAKSLDKEKAMDLWIYSEKLLKEKVEGYEGAGI